MAFDLAVLDRPVDGGDPCGPDLEATGDPEFLAFMATVEGQMPGSFFSFTPAQLSTAEILRDGSALLERTRDVRLMVLLAKVLILTKDLPGFVGLVDGIRRLFEAEWESVKPLPEDGEYALRIAPLYNLDDAATLVFPLQFAPLVEVPRVGTLTYRLHLLATKAVTPREGEIADPGMVERILSECPFEALMDARNRIVTLRDAVEGINRSVIERLGYDYQIGLQRLPPVIQGMVTLLTDAALRRNPDAFATEAPTPEAEAGPEPANGAEAAPAAPVMTGAIRSHADAAAALDVALAYYRRFEPSSPAILLIEQARSILGKSLFEVISILVPQHAGAARIHVGTEPTFVIPVTKAGGNGAEAPGAASIDPVETRPQAIGLLDQVTLFYRQAEPSSPVPLLLDRAKTLANRDFLALLKDLLPEEAIKTMKIGG